MHLLVPQKLQMSLDYLARLRVNIANGDRIMDEHKKTPLILESGHVIHVNYVLKVKKYCFDDYNYCVNPCTDECCELQYERSMEQDSVTFHTIPRKCCVVYVDFNNLNTMGCR